MVIKTIYIETYGCSANQNNSEILAGILSQAGFIITNNIELADLIIINSCVVKGKTESKTKRRIQDLKSKRIIISGCMPETDFKKLKKIKKDLVFLGTHHYKDISKIIRDMQDNQLDDKKQQEYLNCNPEIKLNLPKVPQNKLVSIHQISEGCLGNCSYCKTKLAKGKLFSYPRKEILKSIESDLVNGAKEIWLTSQDNASYGLDRGKNELCELLKEILEIKHRFKLRLGMMDPNNVLPILKELVEVYKDKKMYKFIHIPIQSSSNSVLKDMNRFYKIEEAEKIINIFLKEFPNMVIATDIIVGYPTETEEDHKKNLGFLQEFKPDVFNLSKFSSHKQTKAGSLKQLSGNVIKKRATELMAAHKKTALENKQKYLGRETRVFINERISDNLYRARDENYNIIVLNTSKEFLGKEVDVKIKSTGIHSMIGELIDKN